MVEQKCIIILKIFYVKILLEISRNISLTMHEYWDIFLHQQREADASACIKDVMNDCAIYGVHSAHDLWVEKTRYHIALQ